ncbi:choice-of-anchor E domain-containing protein [Sphaerospermopsis aphanizomenoides BCCUSP55]|uniref:choice-of-anchor E domain-containing protein n=1 Tax=Sphaerospermopsis aphanizomenoides TaxID=459663 RepID=UPI001905B17B|nr:choice-of-anchor E domain-containing protein [Sphaerospermopsis aphanizomenoides]MBK1988784.1 choice-of-anchor E domain-containing protein [Sphaerospermopsis aphanizomenoides BCCUSP55]
MTYKTKSAFFPPKTLVILATASLCSLAISPQAEALTSLGSYTDSFTNQITELNGTPLLTLPKYNGPDTLQQVVFTVSSTLASSGTVTNTASNSQTFTVTLSSDYYDLYASTGSPAALSALVNPGTGATFSPFYDSGVTQIGRTRYVGLAAGGSANFGPFSVNGSTGYTFTNPTDVAGFVGSGTYSFEPFTGMVTSISGGGGNVATNVTTLASTSITVEYFGTVTPVPFGFSTNASLVVFGGVFYGFNKLRKNMAAKKSQA